MPYLSCSLMLGDAVASVCSSSILKDSKVLVTTQWPLAEVPRGLKLPLSLPPSDSWAFCFDLHPLGRSSGLMLGPADPTRVCTPFAFLSPRLSHGGTAEGWGGGISVPWSCSSRDTSCPEG